MKGLIFRSFCDFMEKTYSAELVDKMLSDPALSTSGAFTSVGNYPTRDLFSMVSCVVQETKADQGELVEAFGESLFGVLSSAHVELMASFESCFDMLASIESVIHRDVRKLYNTEELPRFIVNDRNGDEMIKLTYQSSRPLAILARGLMKGALRYYGLTEKSQLSTISMSEDGTEATFRIERK